MEAQSMTHSRGTAGNICVRSVLDRYPQSSEPYSCVYSTTTALQWSVPRACRPAFSKSTTYWKIFLAGNLGPCSCQQRTRTWRYWRCLMAGPRYTDGVTSLLLLNSLPATAKMPPDSSISWRTCYFPCNGSSYAVNTDPCLVCLLTLQIRSAGGQQSPYYAELEAAQNKAQDVGLGLWSKVWGHAIWHLSHDATLASRPMWCACILQDEAAIRSSVRTVHIISEDGRPSPPGMQSHLLMHLLPVIIDTVSITYIDACACVMQASMLNQFCRNLVKANQFLLS